MLLLAVALLFSRSAGEFLVEISFANTLFLSKHDDDEHTHEHTNTMEWWSFHERK